MRFHQCTQGQHSSTYRHGGGPCPTHPATPLPHLADEPRGHWAPQPSVQQARQQQRHLRVAPLLGHHAHLQCSEAAARQHGSMARGAAKQRKGKAQTTGCCVPCLQRRWGGAGKMGRRGRGAQAPLGEGGSGAVGGVCVPVSREAAATPPGALLDCRALRCRWTCPEPFWPTAPHTRPCRPPACPPRAPTHRIVGLPCQHKEASGKVIPAAGSGEGGGASKGGAKEV